MQKSIKKSMPIWCARGCNLGCILDRFWDGFRGGFRARPRSSDPTKVLALPVKSRVRASTRGSFWRQKRIRKSIKKSIRIRMDFERISRPKWEGFSIQKLVQKSMFFFHWILVGFWIHFGEQNVSKMASKNRLNLMWFLDRFLDRKCFQNGRPGEPKGHPERQPKS